MFELGGEALVASDGGPAVIEQLHRGLAEVDHRLDRHEHAGAQLRTGAGATGVDHFRRVMEQATEAMAAEIAHHPVALSFRMLLDRGADVAEAGTWLCMLDADHQALISHLDQPARLNRRFSGDIHPT
jgi:hypothetical protein